MLSLAFLLFAVVHLVIWVWGWKCWAHYGRPRGLFLVLFGALIVLAQGSAVAPFIYALF